MTTDPETIQGWFEVDPAMNYGAHPPEDVVWIDIDGDEGREAWGELLTQHGIKHKRTLTQKSPGGLHYAYRLPANHPSVGNGNRFPAKIDVRGHGSETSGGGYVVGAGSKVNGGAYAIFENVPIAELPPEFLEYFKPAGNKAEDSHEWLCEPDLPENIERARQWLTELAATGCGVGGAVKGQDGNENAFKVAQWLRGWGLSEEQCTSRR